MEEKERRRIAENLHDSLGQTLSLAKLNLSSIIDEEYPERIKKTINNISTLLVKAIKESRDLTYDLSPPILYELGLIPAIEWKIEQVERNNNMEVGLSTENTKIKLKKEINIFLYRIVCELFNNIIKHAKATKVNIEIFVKDNVYHITVTDNGVGFNKNEKTTPSETGGFGLMSIIERLDSIHGTFQIDSELNKGTVVKIKVPLLQQTD